MSEGADEPPLPVTVTHSGWEAKGTILGLEGKTILPVLGGALLSVFWLVLAVLSGGELSLVRWGWILAPVGSTLVFVVGWVHRRPPHYARDWWLGALARCLAPWRPYGLWPRPVPRKPRGW